MGNKGEVVEFSSHRKWCTTDSSRTVRLYKRRRQMPQRTSVLVRTSITRFQRVAISDACKNMKARATDTRATREQGLPRRQRRDANWTVTKEIQFVLIINN